MSENMAYAFHLLLQPYVGRGVVCRLPNNDQSQARLYHRAFVAGLFQVQNPFDVILLELWYEEICSLHKLKSAPFPWTEDRKPTRHTPKSTILLLFYYRNCVRGCGLVWYVCMVAYVLYGTGTYLGTILIL